LDSAYKIGDLVLIKVIGNRQQFDVQHEGTFRIIDHPSSKTYVAQHIKKQTLMKQIMVDSIVPLLDTNHLNEQTPMIPNQVVKELSI
jgi:hypothetical protein